MTNFPNEAGFFDATAAATGEETQGKVPAASLVRRKAWIVFDGETLQAANFGSR